MEEGKKYQFRVRAVNAAGKGKESRPTESVTVETQPEKPSLDLTGLKNITVKAGQPIKIPVPIKGHPPPVASWEQDGKTVTASTKTLLEQSPEQALLHIPKAERGNTGKYTLTLKNPSGTVSGDITVTVLGE